jgi:type IV secretory pathway VirB4 component
MFRPSGVPKARKVNRNLIRNTPSNSSICSVACFPSQRHSFEYPGLQERSWGTVGLMGRSSGNDLLIATSSHGEPLILTREQRSRHLYVTGSTGSGKSKFLEYLIRQDIVEWRKSGCGLLLLDPHGAI